MTRSFRRVISLSLSLALLSAVKALPNGRSVDLGGPLDKRGLLDDLLNAPSRLFADAASLVIVPQPTILYRLDADGDQQQTGGDIPPGPSPNSGLSSDPSSDRSPIPPKISSDPPSKPSSDLSPKPSSDPLPNTLSNPLPNTLSNPLPNTSSNPLPATSFEPSPKTSSHPLPTTSSDPSSKPSPGPTSDSNGPPNSTIASRSSTNSTVSSGVRQTPSATGPIATVSLGTIVGTSAGGFTNWLGIPYAQPPVGDLRLRKPVAPTATYPGGSLQATAAPAACMQFEIYPDTAGLDEFSLAGLIAASASDAKTPLPPSEDCLTLNIYRPDVEHAHPLPVLFYIFGGGFEFGSSNGIDPTSLLTKSKDLGLPIMLVTINHRLGGWGFLAGKELSDEGNTNLGLRDQRLALQWVADNIAAFGGDPARVTIWGHSAGAISVLDHTIINKGVGRNGKPLFAGAIMDSGSIVPTQDTSSKKAQAVFDKVVAALPNCGNGNKLACLRTASADAFKQAVNSVDNVFSDSSVNLAYLPRPEGNAGDMFFPVSPDMAIMQGDYARVPVITSNVQDEGTLFALAAGQRNITTPDEVTKYFVDKFGLAQDVVSQLVSSYDVTAVSADAPRNYPASPLLAIVLGDATFTMMRRAYLSMITKSPGQKAWSFIDSHLKNVVNLGSFHSSELSYIFTGHQVPNQGQQASLPAESYMGADIQERYIRFVNSQDPNAGLDPSKRQWPQYESGGLQMLNYTTNGVQTVKDDFRPATFAKLVADIGRQPSPLAI